MHPETWRKVVHIGMVGFACLIGRLSPLGISAACLLALAFNLIALPRLTQRALERPADRQRGFSIGLLAYPAILLLLSLIFFRQQVFLAVGWGAMAFGDGCATLIGRRFGRHPLPWNRHKTWEGSLAFCLAGGLGTAGLLHLLPAETLSPLTEHAWAIVLLWAIGSAALAESVADSLNDNLVVPLVAATVAYLVVELPPAEQWAAPVGVGWALGAVGLAAASAVVSKRMDLVGGLTGWGVAVAIFMGGGWTGLFLLLLFFVLGSGASRWRLAQKERLGVAEANRGQRSVRNAVANGGVAAVCGLMAWWFPAQATLWQAMQAGSLASATADTLASELGNVYGRHYVNILTFRPDLRGRDGAISLEGTLLGAAGSLLLAVAFGLTHAWPVAAGVGLAGVLGNAVDSVLGATLQRHGYLSNHTVNLMNTLFAAGLMYLIVSQ
ncbi:TIGR00297 family protein [Catalinimonas alkaloidigena]|uniref:TIGR00297 family protein n=1 Tax=Catalinimonas alkaloidigena TaxID=1075417 RepID=A0A1G9UM59_9BACT|nr:DUF92 domain-containing protein [Catalinimonas alkaloidigena]SDM61006.1 TIGR00297 family protein [Catalinimonas alkaloidigena]